MDDYAQREAYALENQGLTALRAHLPQSFVVEQTGGFCMALVRYAGDVVTVVTGEAVEDYTVGTYTLEAWTGEDSVEPSAIAYGLTASQVLDTLAARDLYAADDAVKATVKGSDEYLEARVRLAAAREAYDAHMASRATAYVATIRNGRKP